MGTILDFLQDALQEEAEATVESLKQNYAASRRVASSSSSPPFSFAPIPIPKRAADDVDMETVQNDLDDIMGALSRRKLAKARPL